jgi:hypothetical protein
MGSGASLAPDHTESRMRFIPQKPEEPTGDLIRGRAKSPAESIAVVLGETETVDTHMHTGIIKVPEV